MMKYMIRLKAPEKAEDMEDLLDLRQAKEEEGAAETVTLDELTHSLG